MSYMSTLEEHDDDDDDELPSYESCLSEFTAEAASANPGELRLLATTSEISSFAPEIPFPTHPQAQIAGSPPIIPTGTKPTNSAGTDLLVNHSQAGPDPGSPVTGYGPPHVRRETRPDTFSDTQASPTGMNSIFP